MVSGKFQIATRKREYLWLALVCLAFYCAFLISFRPGVTLRYVFFGEPMFGHRTLTQWLNSPDQGESTRAIQSIGTRSIPFLIGEIRRGEPASPSHAFAISIVNWLDFHGPVAKRIRQGGWPGSVLSTADMQRAFEILGPQGRGARSKLKKLARTPGCRDAAMAALRGMGYDAWPEIVELLEDANPTVRWTAVTLLCQFGPARGREILPFLVKRLDDPDPQVRLPAIMALSGLTNNGPEVVSILRRKLSSSDLSDAMTAAAALAQMGPLATTAVPDLVSVLREKGPLFLYADWPLSVAVALARIDPTAEWMTVRKILADRLPASRWPCAELLAEIDPPFLEEELVRQCDRGNFMNAYRSLILLKNPSDKVLALYMREVGSPNLAMRYYAADGLARMGSRAKPAVPQLLDWFAKCSGSNAARVGTDIICIDPTMITEMQEMHPRFRAPKELLRPPGQAGPQVLEALERFGRGAPSAQGEGPGK